MTAAPARTYRVADLFCGAGGSSTGATRAIQAMGAAIDLVAVNHWDVAIATHARNHPQARNVCINLDAARPEELVPEGQLDLLMASPECVHFSRARGGKPVTDQRRVSAWHVQRWATVLNIARILVENVAEFREWGPVLPDGRPDPKRKGVYFQAWLTALREMGYSVDYRLLNAADYGGATTRTRLFIQARKDGSAIRWPEPTHAQTGGADMFGSRAKWRAAREVIDWSNRGTSLLTRKKPLSVKTRLRIARGLQRFGGALAPAYIALLDLPPTEARDAGIDVTATTAGGPQPFVFANRQNNAPKSDGEPTPTFTTATGGGVAIVQPEAEPFISPFRNHTTPRGAGEPMPTITAGNGSGGMALVEPLAEPFVLGQQSCAAARETDQPLPTVATAGAISLVEPMVTPYYGTGVASSTDDPLPTATTKARFGLCSPLVVPYGPKADARSVDSPVPTVLTRDRLGVAVPEAEPFIVPQFGEAPGQEPRVHAIDSPLPAVTSHGAGALVAPSLVHVAHGGVGGDGRVQSVETPLPTVTTKRSVAVVEPVLVTTDQTGGHGLYVRPVDEPMATLTTKANQAVVEPVAEPTDGEQVDPRRLVAIDGVTYLLDIRFRMLTNRELARAMGFDSADAEYLFTGNVGEVTRQIGNAVEVNTAAALVGAILGSEVLL